MTANSGQPYYYSPHTHTGMCQMQQKYLDKMSSTTTTTTTTSSSPHLLVIPFPAQGHLLPLLDVTHHLSAAAAAAASTNLTVTILTTPKNLPLLSPILSASPSIQPLLLPLPDPSHPEHVRDISPPSSSVATLIRSLSLLSPAILSWAASLHNPPTAVVSDFFLGWTASLARDLGVPRVNFCTSAAILLSILDVLFHRGLDGVVPPLPPPLPPSFPYDHLPSIFRRCRANAGAAEWDFVKDSMVSNAQSYGTVLNTFDALEGEYLDHLRRSYGHDRVWAVGPVAALRGGAAAERCLPEADAAAWLATCPPRSVVYVCFGSQFKLQGPHARALAEAVEASGVRFVWAGQAELPEGFEERTRGRGRVLAGWAPQKALLGHGAVGSFVTHCGWNSVLEGVAAGVLLLAWPMEADQFVDARLLVDVKKVALRACEGGPSAVPEVGPLARVLAESVDGGKHLEVKAKVEEMRRMAVEAVGDGGTSYRDMGKFARELTQLAPPIGGIKEE